MITIKSLYDGFVPDGYMSTDTVPEKTGFYTAICIVGSVNAKVQEMTKMYKQYSYNNDDGTPAGRWVEGDWIKVMCWKERE